ncbi:DegQ family serine endoprotease [Shumkonia mesophila]|uniref:DegQ family serine endoprotease n=1 Tax=Shumkonia mesophila TaxID=2838854 RepID=UPI002934EC0C|nr:DegQ family serine endoprotease [Shumkonia mesophila]
MHTDSTRRTVVRPLWKKAATVAALAAVIGGTATTAYVAGRSAPAMAAPPNDLGAKSAPAAGLVGRDALAPMSFRTLAQQVTPAVVNIATTIKGGVPAMMDGEGASPFPDLPPGSPFEEFFKRFMPPGQQFGQPGQPERHALGSGFIISPDGYIVTNNHVVDGASEVAVTLPDQRQLKAEPVGVDPKTDLALLKVKADAPLPYVPWGDSDTAATGDWVMAVGNPFGLGGTVTAGIVSARGRDLHAGPYDNFIQIDAPINRGNSGGPTFNMEGQVVGINSAIYSPNGGSVGIGFAIPSNLARSVIEQLRQHGKVERGWIGVQVQAVTPEIAKGLGLDAAKGALVVVVSPDSPAAKAGLKSGDVILKVAGDPINDMRELPRLVAAKPKGTDARFVVWRDGKEKTFAVTVAPMPAEQTVAAADDGPAAAEPTLGMTLTAIEPPVRQRLGIPEDIKGVLVTGVRGDSPAASAGINPGDIIEKVGPSTVDTPEDVAATLKAARAEKRSSVLMMVNHGGQKRFVALDIGTA